MIKKKKKKGHINENVQNVVRNIKVISFTILVGASHTYLSIYLI